MRQRVTIFIGAVFASSLLVSSNLQAQPPHARPPGPGHGPPNLGHWPPGHPPGADPRYRPPPIRPGTPTSEESAEDAEARKEIKAEIRKRLTEKVDAQLDPEALAARLKITYPVEPRTREREDIEAEIKAACAEAIKTEFAHKSDRKAQFEKEAAEKYLFFEKGDHIVVHMSMGGALKGRFYGSGSRVVKIGDRRITKADIVEESLAQIDANINRKYREKYIRVQMLGDRNQKEKIADRVRTRMEDDLYPASGYVKWKRKWVVAAELFDRAVEQKRRALAKRLTKAAIEEVVAEHDAFQLQDGQLVRVQRNLQAGKSSRDAFGVAEDIWADEDDDVAADLFGGGGKSNKPKKKKRRKLSKPAPPPGSEDVKPDRVRPDPAKKEAMRR